MKSLEDVLKEESSKYRAQLPENNMIINAMGKAFEDGFNAAVSYFEEKPLCRACNGSGEGYYTTNDKCTACDGKGIE